MAEEFTPITTQEQLDSVLKERLKRSEEKWAKKYEGYVSPEDVQSRTAELEAQLQAMKAQIDSSSKSSEDFEKQIKEKDEIIAKYELRSVKQQVCIASGLPFDFADRLTGSNKEEIEKDAGKLVDILGKSAVKTTPLKDPSANKETDGVLAAFKAMNPNIKI